ncbi:MAG: DUF4382 domain-containing protein [Myxococcota bacterium]
MRGFGVMAACLPGMLAGCTGEVDVYLVDRSVEPLGGELAIEELLLPLDRVEAMRDGGWVALARGPDPYNLLDFSGEPGVIDLVTLRDTPARVAHDEIAVGPISALRLVLMPGEDFVIETSNGVTHPLTVAPDAAWRVDLSLEVGGDLAASQTFDLHVRDAIVLEEDGTWSFAPTLEPVEE